MGVAMIVAALITGVATVVAAFVTSRMNRYRSSYFIPFAVVSAIALTVVVADLRDDGSDKSESSVGQAAATRAHEVVGGSTTADEALDGTQPATAGGRAACPSSSEFERVGARSSKFQVEDLPGSSEVIVQLTAQGENSVVIVTVCEDSSGNPWYFSRVADKETTGIVAPAEAADDGYEARAVFDDAGPVTYVVAPDGVDTDVDGVNLPLQHLVCVDETVDVGGFDELGDVSPCTDAVIRPWTP